MAFDLGLSTSRYEPGTEFGEPNDHDDIVNRITAQDAKPSDTGISDTASSAALTLPDAATNEDLIGSYKNFIDHGFDAAPTPFAATPMSVPMCAT